MILMMTMIMIMIMMRKIKNKKDTIMKKVLILLFMTMLVWPMTIPATI